MPDFVEAMIRKKREGYVVDPDFKSSGDIEDLMVRGGAFYAAWDPVRGLWSRNEYDAFRMIDDEVWRVYDELKHKKGEDAVIVAQTMQSFSCQKVTEWKRYLKASPDRYHELDMKVTFASDEVKKEDYVSKRLPYDLSDGPCPGYEKLMSTLYSETERAKLEWAIGSILCGDSVDIQKFIVLYGSAGTGKSTVLNIIQQLFDGYFTVFEAKALASNNNSFALEQFRSNPLVAIQHDGDLSRIADNTKLNSIVSHEPMMVNEKFKAQYESKFSAFLFMGSNKPVMITEAKSGLIRRLIDVRPTGDTLPHDIYNKCMARIPFELGAIAQHCLDVYKSMGKNYYDKYKPTDMFGATNDMYNFVYDHYDIFVDEKYVTLKMAWTMYKEYVEETKMQYPFSMRIFKAELGNYFDKFDERVRLGNGDRLRNVYRGFKKDMFQISEFVEDNEPDDIDEPYFSDEENEWEELDWLDLTYMDSKLNYILADCPAQYANASEKPTKPWDKVTTSLKDLDPHKLHYVMPPDDHIVIDFDVKDEDGNKSLEKNIAIARSFPPTYAELSKSGQGLHLHYIYTGDLDKLESLYADNVEIKVFRGKASLRRRLTRCNGLDLTVLSSGLPVKGEKVLDKNDISVKDERHLIARINACLQKKHHGATTPEVHYIYDTLEDAYKSGMHYDVRRMRNKIKTFCQNSSNQAVHCLKLFGKMKLCSADVLEDTSEPETEEEKNYILKDLSKPPSFFDIEVAPNLLLICVKDYKDDNSWLTLFNPTPQELDPILEKRLWGFNNLGYDNPIVYARYTGASNMDCYHMSKDIIAGNRAINPRSKRISEGDLYDISSKKQSLKKWEIEMKIDHDELDIDWDQPIPEELWDRVAEYCMHDVRATEALYDTLKEDIDGRTALAQFSGLTVNERGRAHCTRIIFGNEKHPRLVYTDLSTGERTDGTRDIVSFPGYEYDARGIDHERYTKGKIVSGKSIYKGYDPGEGGFVYAEPGMHYNVALLDVASMHPTSMICENIFGDYTQKFKEIYEARLAIKHKDIEKLKTLLGGALIPYTNSDEEMDALASALKLVINSVYGYTTATFENPFRDPRNDDNIVAKRGALFMIDLKEAVEARGFKVAHIKTDSIKIPNATNDIIEFVREFGKKYGYTFEHEATYERMCLMNDAVYIAKYDDKGIRNKGGKHAGEWTATGKQFQVPYVFKTLFSGEEIIFDDLCETRSVKTKLYLDMNESMPEGEHNYIFVGRVGQFTPIKPGKGGGQLLRKSGDGLSYSAVAGTKGYRWLESSVVRTLDLDDVVDLSYYKKLADDAINDISKFGDFESFVNGEALDIYVNAVPFMNPPTSKGE